MPAGYAVPVRLTVRQERYCRRAIGITRFIFNLCVATHRFCRTNRLLWPSWQDLYKYDGKRRIRLPVIGYVKMAHTLLLASHTKRISASGTAGGY